MVQNKKDKITKQNEGQPSTSTHIDSATALPQLDLMRKIFEQVEKESGKIAEQLFDYLFDVDDISVITGNIPMPKNKKHEGIKKYIKSLNLLFKLSHIEGFGSFRIINRKMVKELNKKTYTFCMCVDGGTSLDVLCEVVNQENMARTPSKSPVKITVRQVTGEGKGRGQ
jgi:hypothetical protein